MQSITEYTRKMKSEFTIAMPKYSVILDTQVVSYHSGNCSNYLMVAVLSDEQWPLIERTFYLFTTKDYFDFYSGIPNDYFIPLTYVGLINTSDGKKYLFVKDEDK